MRRENFGGGFGSYVSIGTTLGRGRGGGSVSIGTTLGRGRGGGSESTGGGGGLLPSSFEIPVTCVKGRGRVKHLCGFPHVLCFRGGMFVHPMFYLFSFGLFLV
jgi:hypothetical protein